MPIYEYQCNECQEEFEKMVRLSEADAKQECPKCHSKRTRKRLSKVAAQIASGGSPVSNCGSGGRFS